jgi:quinol monooxygenase YgiN
MIVEYIRYTIDEERTEAFEQAYRDASETLEASEHCELYDVSRCTEDPTQHVVRIEWTLRRGIWPASARALSSVASSRRLARS